MSTTPVKRPPLPYRDPALSVGDRVEDLLGRMTLEEKVAQVGSVWAYQLTDADSFSNEKAGSLLQIGLGHVTRVSGAGNLDAAAAARLANSIQRYLITETRLGIPAIIHEEVCSGLMARDATVFPQAIGVASTWEPDLAEAMAGLVRSDMRARGAHQGLSPVLDVSRDPRWGRTEETFGEDPHLVASMGVAFVRGLQGSSLVDGVIATAKHFVGYSASEGGLNWAPAHIPSRELREVYLHPFEAVVKTAGLRSIMNGYHELDGIPCTADQHLLTGVLREDWGFNGSVVSDYFAVRQLVDYHKIAADASEAAQLALEAGIDVELPGTDCYGAPLLEAIVAGRVSERTLDVAVQRVLAAKFELGLFDNPYVESNPGRSVIDIGTHEELAVRIARKSIVLLRNDGVLPIAPAVGVVAVIGPNAHSGRHLLGDYCYSAHIESLLEMRDRGNVFSIPSPTEILPDESHLSVPTVLDALRDRLQGQVRYAQGCSVHGDSTEGFAEAVDLAANADVAVMVMGDKSGLTDDCTSGEGRDRLTLDLPGVQEDLVRAVVATGTPVVLVLVAGRPTGSAWAHEYCSAVVMAWMPGVGGGAAVADVLAGVFNPGGKLPITHPRSAGQIPVYFGHKASGGRSHWKGDYVDGPSDPLYPFGHGLSYTTFELSHPVVGPSEVGLNGSIAVQVDVANTGDTDGEEVVQLYTRDPRASVTRPVLELKGFVRVEVPTGGSRRVVFGLPVGQIGFHDRDLNHVVEPGAIEIYLGTSSRTLQHAGTVTVVDDGSGGPIKSFGGTVEVT